MDAVLSGPVAFAGLGAMGSGMAASLARAGVEVRAFDLDPAARARAAEARCRDAATLEEACTGSVALVTMLPTGAHVSSLLAAGMSFLAPGALVIDCSTIAVDEARAHAARATARGLAPLDAPVSGGTAAAAAGTLTFMVGGEAGAFARAQPLLAAMGRAVIHAGAAGAGQAAKICNNMLLAVSMIATCEAFDLAERLGLDARAFFDIASRSSGQCWSMTSYAPVPGLVDSAPSNRGFEGGFAGALMLKDLRLALAAAEGAGAARPMARKAEEIYSEYVVKMGASRDFSGVIDMLRQS